MTEQSNPDRLGSTIAVVLVAAIASYLPAGFAYDRITRGAFGSGEAVLAHSLEVMLIAAPLGALAFAAMAGWITWRAGHCPKALKVMLAVAAVGSVALTQLPGFM